MLLWPYKEIVWFWPSFEQQLQSLTIHLANDAYRRFWDQDDLLEVLLECELNITKLRHEIYDMVRKNFLGKSFHAETTPKSKTLLETDFLKLKNFSKNTRSYEFKFYFIELDKNFVYIDTIDYRT